METAKKIDSLNMLRGIAVIIVCFCHFGYPLTLEKSNLEWLFKMFLTYGSYGVQIFFVVSGFIIPLSMDKAQYNIKYYFKFLLKSAVRLHPPYLIALAITLFIVFVSNILNPRPFPESFTSIIESCFYIYILKNNPVFWTLRIEAEYYIFMGLYFALLKAYPKLAIGLVIPILLILTQTAATHYIDLLNYITYFMIGTMGYLVYVNLKAIPITAIGIILVFSAIYINAIGTIVAFITLLCILFYKGRSYKYLDFIGEISYSIYLLHYPIGTKILYLTNKHVPTKLYPFLFFVPFIVLIPLCFSYWKFIENPSAKYSNLIKYGTSKKNPTLVTMSN